MARDEQRRGLGALPDAPRSGMDNAGTRPVTRTITDSMSAPGSARRTQQVTSMQGPQITVPQTSPSAMTPAGRQQRGPTPVRGSVPNQRKPQANSEANASTPAEQTPSPQVPRGTYDALPEGPGQMTDQRLTGDVGTRNPQAMSASGSSSSSSRGPGVGVDPSGAVGAANALGIMGPASAPEAEVAPVRGADTDQTLRNNLQDQQAELYKQFLDVSERAANAPLDTEEQFQQASALQTQADQLAETLGIATQGGTRTFAANRSRDSTIQGAGIDANAEAAIANADNQARLGISANRERANIFGDLLDTAEARQRSQASVAAARAQNAPSLEERLKYQFVAQEAERDFGNAANMLWNNENLFGDEEILTDETSGRPNGLVRLRDGSIARVSPQVLNQLQRFQYPGLGVEGE